MGRAANSLLILYSELIATFGVIELCGPVDVVRYRSA
jgi:hypothetical protein